MIRKAGNEPQVQQTHFEDTEHTSSRHGVEQDTGVAEQERPSRTDGGRSQRAESLLTEQGNKLQLQRQMLDQRADAIHNACEGLGTDEKTLFQNLSGLSESQRKELNQIYQQKYGITLEQELRGELSGEELKKGLSLLNGKDPKPDQLQLDQRADAIHNACEGLGTDEKTLFQNLSGLSESQRKELNQIYQQKYGMTLEQQLRGELSGDELQKGLSLLNGKDPKPDLQNQGHLSTRRTMSSQEAALRSQLEPGQLLSNGSRGAEVEQLQAKLNEWRAQNGKPPIGQDGKFGKETEAALRDFQAANGLASDGIAGPKTKALLG